MKKILIVLAVGTIAVLLYFHFGSGIPISLFHKPEVTIADLKSSSEYADSLIELHDLRVKEALSLFNFTVATCSDRSGDTITVISNRPYLKGEILPVLSGRYVSVFNDGTTHLNIFITREINIDDVVGLLKDASVFKTIF